MPFSKLNTSQTLDSPDNPPLVVFPGIFLYGLDVQKLVKELEKIQPDRSIYVWHHPKYDFSRTPAFTDLKNLVDVIIQDILALQKDKPKWNIHNLLGVSWGAILAEMAAHGLKEKNPDDIVNGCFVDSPTLGALQKHYKPKNPVATRDLVDILNATAKMSAISEQRFSDEEIQRISELDFILSSESKEPQSKEGQSKKRPGSQFSEIYSQLTNGEIDLQTDSLTNFHLVSKVIAEQIKLVPTAIFEPTTKLDALMVLTTEETRNKFHCSHDTGRAATARKISSVDLSSEDKSMTHQSCINEANSPFLAAQISGHFDLELALITAKQLIKRQPSPPPMVAGLGTRRHVAELRVDSPERVDFQDRAVFDIPESLRMKSRSPGSPASDTAPLSPDELGLSSDSSPSSGSDDDAHVIKRSAKQRISHISPDRRPSPGYSRFFRNSPPQHSGIVKKLHSRLPVEPIGGTKPR